MSREERIAELNESFRILREDKEAWEGYKAESE
jgi:hypothetical protein